MVGKLFVTHGQIICNTCISWFHLQSGYPYHSEMIVNFMTSHHDNQTSNDERHVHFKETPNEFKYHMDNFTDTMTQTEKINQAISNLINILTQLQNQQLFIPTILPKLSTWMTRKTTLKLNPTFITFHYQLRTIKFKN